MPRLDPSKSLTSSRLAIETVSPTVNDGRFAAKCVEGWKTRISADIFADGHEVLGAAALVAIAGEDRATEVPLAKGVNDVWEGVHVFHRVGPARFRIIAWRDIFGTWARDTGKKVAAGQSVEVEMIEGRAILAATKAVGEDRKALTALRADAEGPGGQDALLSEETAELMARIGPRANLTKSQDYPMWVDREAAAFSSWYELFPRSIGGPDQHGTFRDVEGHLPYVTDMGFDTLYFPPIHPIGKTNRKGKNNTLTAADDDVGSPYAIGSTEGGHMAVHPDLGTMDDFDHLVATARGHGLDIALDIALNASPDHPWLKEHPEWFEWRPDGTIKYAENPPKKYEDIVNFRYYNDDGTPNLPFWHAILDVFEFWAEHGVLCFRVDNPHTKPFPFWEWIIAEVRKTYPEAVFLSEAFTRPKVMKRLAKLGYNQSYSYFTWRTEKHELIEYLTELTTEACADYMRVNFFVNTPDINPIPLQTSGRAGFQTRAILAGGLAGNWGLYSGFEYCEGLPMPGKEEYLDSEKYQLRHRDPDMPGHIRDDVRLINTIRRENLCMKNMNNLRFVPAYDDRVLSWLRHDRETGNAVFFHVLLDPHEGAEFAFEVPLWEFDLPAEASIEVTDLVQGNSFTWHGRDHRLTLDPHTRPYAIWKLTPPGAQR